MSPAFEVCSADRKVRTLRAISFFPPLLSASPSKCLWFLSTSVQHLGRSSRGRGLVRTPHLGEGSFLFPSEKHAFCKVSSEEEKKKTNKKPTSRRLAQPPETWRKERPPRRAGREKARRVCRGPPGARSPLAEGAGSRGAEGSRAWSSSPRVPQAGFALGGPGGAGRAYSGPGRGAECPGCGGVLGAAEPVPPDLARPPRVRALRLPLQEACGTWGLARRVSA